MADGKWTKGPWHYSECGAAVVGPDHRTELCAVCVDRIAFIIDK